MNFIDNDGWAALNGAATEGHQEIVRLLIDKGADLNIAIMNGSTALHMAPREGHQEIVRLLLDKGADVNTGIASLHFTMLPKKDTKR